MEFGERSSLPPPREETKSLEEYEVLEIVNERRVKRQEDMSRSTNVIGRDMELPMNGFHLEI